MACKREFDYTLREERARHPRPDETFLIYIETKQTREIDNK